MLSKQIQTVTIMLMIIALCITCISIVMYNITAVSIKQEISTAYNVSLLNTRERMESYFHNIDQLTLQFEALPEVVNLVQGDRDPVGLGIVTKQMLRLHASIDFVTNIVVYNRENHEMLATDNTLYPQYSNYSPVFQKFSEMKTDKVFISMQVDGNPLTVFIRKLPVFSQAQNVYILFQINSSIFDHILGKSDYHENGSYFIVDERGQLVANRGFFNDESVRPWVNMIYQSHPAIKEDSSAVFNMPGSFITYLAPSYNGWSYAFAISNESFLHKALLLRDVTLKISVILFLAAVILSFVFSHWLWRGWHKMKSLLDNNQMNIEPKPPHNEFDFYLEKIQTLVNQSKHLKKQSDEMLPQLKESISLSLLLHGVRSPETLEKIKQYGIQFKEGSYCCFCVAIDFPQEAADLYSPWDVTTLEYAVVLVMKEVIEEEACGFAVNTLKGHAAAVVCGEKLNSAVLQEIVRQITQTVHQFVQQYFPITVSIGVSKIRTDVNHLNICYSEAQELLKKRLISERNHIYYATELEEETAVETIPFREMENDIFYGIRIRDRNLAYKALEQLYVLKEIESINYKWFQNKMIELTRSIFRQLYHRIQGLDIHEPTLDEMLQLSTLDDWVTWLKQGCIDTLVNELEKQHRLNIATVTKQIEDFVSEHVETDLQIEDCCKSLGIPVSFARQALKDEMDITFNELILRTRIERAKEWFEAEDYGVEEVARRLQYSNAQNFTRVFKKAVGVPPGQYRTEVRYLKKD